MEAKLSQARHRRPGESLQVTSRELQALVRQAPRPDLEEAILQAARALPTPWLAVRSSAVGEDSEFSFAGQFATLLNVDAASLPEHYKEIVASKFTSRAIFYWKYREFSVMSCPWPWESWPWCPPGPAASCFPSTRRRRNPRPS